MSTRRSPIHRPIVSADLDSSVHPTKKSRSRNKFHSGLTALGCNLSRYRQRSVTSIRKTPLVIPFRLRRLVALCIFFRCAFSAFHWVNSSRVKPERLFVPRGISNLKDLGYPVRPRTVGYYFASESVFIGHQTLPVDIRRQSINRFVYTPEGSMYQQRKLKDEHFYSRGMADPMEEGDCIRQYDWQVTSYPTCNSFHEIDLSDLGKRPWRSRNTVSAVRGGFRRDTWIVEEYNYNPRIQNKLTMEVLNLQTLFIDRDYDRHRRDSLVMDRMTQSKFVPNIYGYCGMSTLSEYPDGGLLHEMFHHKRVDTNTTLRVALDVARGVASLHNLETEGIAAVAHTDISSDAFEQFGDRFKLRGFGRCRFIKWDKRENKACNFEISNNGGIYRSPEEYEYKEETEKVDVYSMGNVFYLMLTGNEVFYDDTSSRVDSDKVKDDVMKGSRPKIARAILDDTSPAISAIVEAIRMCWTHDAIERPTARDIEKLLAKVFKT